MFDFFDDPPSNILPSSTYFIIKVYTLYIYTPLLFDYPCRLPHYIATPEPFASSFLPLCFSLIRPRRPHIQSSVDCLSVITSVGTEQPGTNHTTSQRLRNERDKYIFFKYYIDRKNKETFHLKIVCVCKFSALPIITIGEIGDGSACCQYSSCIGCKQVDYISNSILFVGENNHRQVSWSIILGFILI